MRQVQAHTPSAGEIAHRAFELFVAEAQTVQQARGARADGPRVDSIQFAVNRGDGVAVVTLVGGVEFGFQLAVFAVAVNHIVESRNAQGRGFLVNPGQLPVSRIGEAACIGAHLVFQKRQQGGFAAAVFAHQTDFLPRVNGGCSVVQQDAYAATNL
ncbi:hypothetical protein D3C71_1288240 [compost metagenome]